MQVAMGNYKYWLLIAVVILIKYDSVFNQEINSNCVNGGSETNIDRSLDSINKKSGNLENGSEFYKVDNKQQALRFTDTESNEGYEEYLEVANLVSEIRKTVCRLDSENASNERVIRESEMFAFLIAIKEVSPRMFTDMEATVWNSVDCENEENWIEKTRELYKIYYGWNESIFKWVKNIGTLEYETNKRFEKFS